MTAMHERQFRVMCALSARPGASRRELAAAVGTALTNISHDIAVLEAMGYVERRPGRSRGVRATVAFVAQEELA
jgi:DNA-binding MarR family transcriptional regulator